jgi:hypothetical protein
MLFGISAIFGEESVPGRLEQQGQAIAEKFCAECHWSAP